MKTLVIAIGGNALIPDAQHRSVPDQYAAVVKTVGHLTDLLEQRHRIVITHGTDTMEQTASVLGNGIGGKTIVLTGAMIPYTFGSSDGLFNLGTALAFVQTLEPGVYVAMNGRCFPWHSVRKNRERGSFESL